MERNQTGIVLAIIITINHPSFLSFPFMNKSNIILKNTLQTFKMENMDSFSLNHNYAKFWDVKKKLYSD